MTATIRNIRETRPWSARIPQEYLLVVIWAMLAYFVAYLLCPATPGNAEKYFLGWFGWNDQGQYLASATAIAQAKLSSATYVYPLGYPLLAAPFLSFLPRHPFFLPNLFFAVGIVLSFYASCRTLLSTFESTALVLFLIIF